MTTQFDDWLRQLSRSRRRIPDKSVTIDRGLPFRWPFAMDGDWSGSTVAASLRLYPDAEGATLVDFMSDAPVYDAELDVTLFSISLTPGQTASLPGDDEYDGVVSVALDVLLTPSGSKQFRLMGGEAVIAGKVTNG